jgi:Mycotoxin biosynthesis protein UstYa
MCHSDITLLPYQWINSDIAPVLNFGRAHECVNWELVNNWAGDRLVDISEPGYIRHPNLGMILCPALPFCGDVQESRELTEYCRAIVSKWSVDSYVYLSVQCY